MTIVLGTKVWLDTETTGLEDEDDIIQIGVVITDDDLNILATQEWLVPGDLRKCNEFCVEMHFKSGLLHQHALRYPEEIPTAVRVSSVQWVAAEVYAFIIKHCPLDDKGMGTGVFCNNSVQFDDRMLRNNMPKVLEAMHYRRIDISTLRRTYRDESRGAVDPGKPACPHTALGDALTALQEYKDLNRDYKAWVIQEYLDQEALKRLDND
jgi:oligoribonuclease